MFRRFTVAIFRLYTKYLLSSYTELMGCIQWGNWNHTIQNRWIQTELAFTLAKNATKPNPFEIIALQTSRKENNWKTEEALARAAVTVETERINGSNPWCLWWWWCWWLTYSLTYLLTPSSRVLLEKLTGSQLVKTFPYFMESEDSLPHSKVPTSCPDPEPARSSSYPQISLPKYPS